MTRVSRRRHIGDSIFPSPHLRFGHVRDDAEGLLSDILHETMMGAYAPSTKRSIV